MKRKKSGIYLIKMPQSRLFPEAMIRYEFFPRNGILYVCAIKKADPYARSAFFEIKKKCI
jgi:hypothetical protein